MDTRIVIVANDPLVRTGLAAMIEGQPGCIVVGQAATTTELPTAIDLYHPDVGLVDLGMDLENPRNIFEIDANLPLVLLCPAVEFERFVLAWQREPVNKAFPWIKLSGRAYLARGTSPQSISRAFPAILDGLVVLDPSLEIRRSGDDEQLSGLGTAEGLSGPDLQQKYTETHPADTNLGDFEELTPRELEVLSLVAEGLQNKRIAQRLGISEHTVKFHVNAIIGKLGVESRTEAVTRAARLGVLKL